MNGLHADCTLIACRLWCGADEEGWDFEPMNKVILDREYDIVEATKDWKGVSIGARRRVPSECHLSAI